MLRLISVITQYLFVEDAPEKADVLFVPGGASLDPAKRAAELYLEGFAPLIVPSGDRWLLHRSGESTECEQIAETLLARGVPQGAILREPKARHTLDNARLTKGLLDNADIRVHTAILCCQSFHARRCLKAYRRYFPQTRLLVCPAPSRGISREDWYQTPLGLFKAATELMKCTGLFFFLIGFFRA